MIYIKKFLFKKNILNKKGSDTHKSGGKGTKQHRKKSGGGEAGKD